MVFQNSMDKFIWDIYFNKGPRLTKIKVFIQHGIKIEKLKSMAGQSA